MRASVPFIRSWRGVAPGAPEPQRLVSVPLGRFRLHGALPVWLAAAVLVNVAVGLLLHGGLRDRLAGLLPEPPFTGKPGPGRWICAAWGPFSEPAAMNALIARIDALGGESEPVAGRRGAGPDYVLLIGPQGSFESARRIREELGSQSIDSHIVSSGTLARSLEVGVFPVREEAVARRTRIEALGYRVHLRELERSPPALHLIARLERVSAPELPPAKDCGVIAPGHRFL